MSVFVPAVANCVHKV